MNKLQQDGMSSCKSRLAIAVAGFCGLGLYSGGEVLAAERQNAIEEIVVTANKRSQSISDVGLSITAATGETLIDRGITSPTDLGKLVPGLTVQPAPFNTPVYTLRGVGFYETTLSAAPTVAVYVDEIQLPFSATTKGATFDIERLEVLKGPQGTLFGQNTTGGAINYIANKPTDEFEAGVDLAVARFGKTDVQGFVSGPLTDTVNARLALNAVQGGAWQKSYTRDDELGDQDQLQGRFTLDWEASEKLDVRLTVSAWTDQSETQAAQMITDLCADDFTSPSCLPYQAEDFRNYSKAPAEAEAADWGYGVFGRNPERDDSFYQTSVRLDYEISESLTLTSISAYSDYDTDSVQDFDGTSLASVDTNTTGYIKDFNQEIRIAGEYESLNFIVGANYNTTDTYDRLFYNFSEGPSSNPTLSPRGGLIGDYTFNYSDQDIEGRAVFGNIEYELSDAWMLSAGARYTETDRDFEGCTNDYEGPSQTADWWNFVFGVAFGIPGVNVQNGGCLTFDENLQTYDPALFDELNEDNVSWNIGLNYKMENDGLLYGRISKGYKSGSFPTASVASYTGYAPVEQESILAYEVGIKTPLFDNRVNLTAAAFFYDYEDKQLRGRKPDPVFVTLDGLVQVPEGEAKGIEFGIQAVPVDGLSLSLGGTYIETEIKEYEGFNALGQTLNFQGQDFPFAPELTLIGDAQYDFSVSDQLDGFVGVSFTHNGEASSQLDNTTTEFVTADPRFDLDSYTLWDIRAGIRSADDKWKVMLYSYNVTDEYYWTNVQNNLVSITRFAGMPRTYGARVSLRF